jgi:uncharacterized protein (DUF58 family)
MLGEDARKIDWKSTAKTGEPHVKLFFQEREVNVVLCALMSGSLLFRDKRETLLEVCSLLGYGSLKMQNRLTPVMVDERVTLYPTSKKLHTIEHFIKELDKVELYKKSVDLQNIKLKQKSLIILVGDFLGAFDLSLLANRHEVFIVIIRERFEENPEILGDGAFTDPESGESSEFYFGKSVRDAYAKRYKENDQKLYKHLGKLGISYVKIVTDEDAFVKLSNV